MSVIYVASVQVCRMSDFKLCIECAEQVQLKRLFGICCIGEAWWLVGVASL